MTNLPYRAAVVSLSNAAKGELCMPLRLLDKPIPLKRRGSQLLGQQQTWQMLGLLDGAKIESTASTREYFRVETDCGDLWIFRLQGEKGMREVFLHGLFG